MSERFLLDANLSPITREFPESTFNLDVTDLLSLSLGYLTDLDVVELARRGELSSPSILTLGRYITNVQVEISGLSLCAWQIRLWNPSIAC